MKRTVATLTACLLGAACANRPDSIHASYVSHEKYMELDCPSLVARMSSTRDDLAKQSEVQNAKATGDAIGVFLFGIPFSKLEGDVEGEIARLKGEIEAIDTAMIKNKCGTDALRTAASAPDPATAGGSSRPRSTTAELSAAPAQEANSTKPPRWVAINDPAELRAIYSDTTIKGTVYTRNDQRGVPFVGEFRSDGTGVLNINGERIPRIWRVQGNDQVCTTDPRGTNCYRLQRNANNGSEMRGENVKSSVTVHFTVKRVALTGKAAVSAPVKPTAPPAAISPPTSSPAPTAALRDAGPAPTVPAAEHLPAVGTTWIYRFEDRIFGRRRTDVRIRVENRADASVSEVITTDEGSSKRDVMVENSQVLRVPLGGGTPVLEVAPYLLARSDEGASLTARTIAGYPQGPRGMAPWSIRVTQRGWSPVTVAAGSFRALRVQIDGRRERQDTFWGQDGYFRIVAWYAPEAKRLVKMEHQTWETWSHRLNGHTVLELISFQPPS